jgi:NAD dependent epimerase/dehydratase family
MSESKPRVTSPVGKILVTGATGHLGVAVCESLIAHGYQLVATDRKYVDHLPFKPILGDLLDEHFVYRVVEGCDAVVHLGNHPNLFVGPSAQQILADNVRMNANVFWAAVHVGVRRIVFASSIQVMLRTVAGKREEPYELPYLPLDGNAPADPGTNTYALSKEFGERALQVLCAEHEDLAATALRFPMLPRTPWVSHLRSAKSVIPAWLNWGDCLTHLLLPDAGVIVTRAVGRAVPGYRQYFPAVPMKIVGRSAQEVYHQHYAHVPLKCPISELTELVDWSELKRDFDFEPSDRLEINLAPSTA